MKIAQERSFDLVVIGGGSAGLAAAIAAAQRGLRVALVEQHGFCGGLNTTSMVHTLDGMLAQHDPNRLAVGGIAVEFIDRLHKMGGMACQDNPPESPIFDPEAFKLVSDEYLGDAGVERLYHSRLVDVESRNGRILAAIVHSKAGFWRLAADTFIDASGDGDLCAGAGAGYEISEALQPMTLHFQIKGLASGPTWNQLEQRCHGVLMQAYQAGKGPKFGGPWILRVRAGEISLNCTRHYGNPLDPVDLTRAEVEGRANAWQVWRLWRDALPEFKDSYITVSGPSLGIRESRRITGEYQLTGEDIIRRTAFTDVIGLGAWPIDIHPASGAVGYHPHKENPPPPYPFPFRALLPANLENALAVGRCASTTHQAHGSARVNATAMMMGQAAGTACGLAVHGKRALRDIPSRELQDALVTGGVVIDCERLPLRPQHWKLGLPQSDKH